MCNFDEIKQIAKKYPYKKMVIKNNYKGGKSLWVYFKDVKNNGSGLRMAFDDNSYSFPLSDFDKNYIESSFDGIVKRLVDT